jgi:hypothetical protein
MSENLSLKNELFLFEWSFLNLLGWIIGLFFVYQIHSHSESIYYEFSFWKSILVWLPLGASFGICQWFMLKRFKINLLIWAVVTSLGFSVLFTLLYGAAALNRYGLNLIPQGRVDLGEFIGKIDIGQNITYVLCSIAILLGGFLTSGLQAIIIRRIIPKPWLWIKANMLGFLLPAIIMPLGYFFKHIGLTVISLLRIYFLYVLAGFLLDIFLLILTPIVISIFTGKVLLNQSISDITQKAG